MRRRKKRNQHYVFQGYLRPWSINEKIYCLREGKVFHANLDGVACERFFYRFHDLTPNEIQLIEKAFIEPCPEPLRNMQTRFLNILSCVPRLRKRVTEGAGQDFLSRLDYVIAEGQEDYHQKIEDRLLGFIRKMSAGDMEFYADDTQSAQFLYALCVQFTRTKRVREATVAQIGPTWHGCDTRRVMSVLSLLIAAPLAQSLYLERRSRKPWLLENHSDTPLITADQPIINLQAKHTIEPPDELEFFYPLSPRSAMLLPNPANDVGVSSLSAIAVNRYNMMMVKNSYDQLFSNSQEYLTSIKGLVSQIRARSAPSASV